MDRELTGRVLCSISLTRITCGLWKTRESMQSHCHLNVENKGQNGMLLKYPGGFVSAVCPSMTQFVSFMMFSAIFKLWFLNHVSNQMAFTPRRVREFIHEKNLSDHGPYSEHGFRWLQ